MRYTITSSKEKEAQTSPQTSLAIQAYEKVLKAERSLEKRQKELEGWLSEVPKSELNVYFEVTNELIKKHELL